MIEKDIVDFLEIKSEAFENDFAVNEIYRVQFEPDRQLMEEYSLHTDLIDAGLYDALYEDRHVLPETM